MKNVKIIVESDGSVKIEFQGFKGEQCFQEAQKLYKLLSEMGINVKVEKVVPTEEYYTTSTTKVKQYERNGNSV